VNSNELRAKFLAFFAQKGHTVVPSSPLVPANDPEPPRFDSPEGQDSDANDAESMLMDLRDLPDPGRPSDPD
jgi:hypothetical protein